MILSKIGFVSSLLFLFASCSRQLQVGKYINDKDLSFIEIKKEREYTYKTIGDVHKPLKFSQGSYFVKNNIVTFIPDSTYFFKIEILRYSYDATLGLKRKIIIDPEKNNLRQFKFIIPNSSQEEIILGDSLVAEFAPDLTNYAGRLNLIAFLKEDTFLPKPVHESITSNPIYYSDVDTSGQKPTWNVLIIKAYLNRSMFSFVTLPDHKFVGKRILDVSCPVYQLTSK